MHVDVLALAPRWVRTAYGGGFELLAARAPRIWHEVYTLSDGPGDDAARWGGPARRLLFREFSRLLHSRRWSLCVCTHFLPGQLAAGRPGMPPFVTVITDFMLHRYWVQPRVRSYFVPTPGMAQALHSRLPAATVVASGIPVAPQFRRPPSRVDARRSLGLPADDPAIVIMGGGLGLGVEHAVHAALHCGVPDLNVIAVCGRNAAAEARLRAIGADRLHVLGYTSAVPLLMSAADVVVTKPGGLTCSEALAAGRPLVLTRALPGHEEGNVKYLVDGGAALYSPDPALLPAALRRLFAEPAMLAGATFAAASLGVPGAAAAIAATLRHRIHRSDAA